LKRSSVVVLGLAVSAGALLVAATCAAYPLDGFERTGIRRLLGTAKQQATAGKKKLTDGALHSTGDIGLSLEGRTYDLGAEDPALKAALDGMLATRDPSYLVAVADITDPEAIAWAGVRADETQYPGSVGKLACAVALFDGLRRAFPDPADRERVLRETIIEADAWSAGDSHGVPVYDDATGLNHSRPVRVGDRFTLSEWLDHALSASANSAGAMLWREAMILRKLGSAYPGTPEQRAAVLALPKQELYELSQAIIVEPFVAMGIDPTKFRQATFWTDHGQACVPGQSSFASPRELLHLLLLMEEGRLVDRWSSLELKRYIYFTRKRYRYAYAPELAEAAVYFKSGSLYECAKEEGFTCGKYRGNVRNVMNSVAVVEMPAKEGQPARRYLVALMSNVLRVNSAWDHARIAAAIDEMIRTRKPAAIEEAGSSSAVKDAGSGD
jgi:hypothetical protein